LKAVIIIPTYNERENLSSLIAALQKQFERIRHEMHVLVVDDSSPDGTADVVRKLQASHTNLHLLMGRKQGLGVAYIRGMRHAMDALGAEVVYEMDADFSIGRKMFRS
jgi:dolichol-phosphate mannosyltransferase